MSVVRALVLLALFVGAAAAARADTGTLLIEPLAQAEVAIPARGPGDRVAYRFDVEPAGEVVEFNLHYFIDDKVVVERAPQNLSEERGTFFPLRRTSFYLGFENHLDTPITVDWEWHYVGSIPSTRDTPALGLAGLAGAAALALLLQRTRVV